VSVFVSLAFSLSLSCSTFDPVLQKKEICFPELGINTHKYKISYDVLQDYLKFIIRLTHDSDLKLVLKFLQGIL